MLPPTNRLGGALQIASSVASIYSGFGGASLFENFGKKTIEETTKASFLTTGSSLFEV